MPHLRPRSTSLGACRRLPPWICALLAWTFVAAGCGGGGVDYGALEVDLRAGRLDRVEAALAGLEGERADVLRARLAERRAWLAALAAEIAELEALEPKLAVTRLRARAESERDPIAREQLESALSRAADRQASGIHEREHETASFAARRADAEPAKAPSKLPSKAPSAARPVVANAARVDGEPAPAKLAAAGAPPAAELAAPDEKVELVQPVPPANAPTAAPSEADADPALAAEARGDLARALDSWLEAAFDHPPGPERDAAVAHARALEGRLALRSEILAAFELDPARFAELELSSVDAAGLTVAGVEIGWSSVPLELLARAARNAQLSRAAELGLLAERIARGDAEGPAGALADAWRLVERGALDEQQVWKLVAGTRGEDVPAEGYVFESGRWTPRSEFQLAEQMERVARLETKLAKAGPEQREAVLDELSGLGELAQPAIARALAQRFEADLRDLDRSQWSDSLGRIAEQRRELDRKREAALELIFDEVEYFYPFNPPDVPASKAALYWPVQQEVDRLVASVREVWDAPREVKLSSKFCEALEDLAWTRVEAAQLEPPLALDLPAELPTWLTAIDPRAAKMSLREFAWDAAEAEALAYDRAVCARNEHLWSEPGELTEVQLANEGERRQVRLTNDYRRMLGRPALAWNPLIQEAARMHSDYMSRTGDFGHDEPDPERRGPGDRMRLVGYTSGIGENCAMNGGDPEGAHEGWTHSSGHHRNLLNPGHREMASAVVSRYWTQNFGVDRAFMTELEAWQD